jgi:hypothetical protein
MLMGLASALQAQPTASRPADAASRSILEYMLFLVVVLVGIFLVSSFAFLRWSKHFRRRVFREPIRPTPSEDVWSMHRLPDEEPEDLDETEGQ